ncbi:MAG TPA: hypothetical protein VGF06_17560 [Terriglobales bacterium]
MTIEQRIEFLVKSQESLGKNIEKLYETVSQQSQTIQQHEDELQRFRRAMRAALEAWLDNNGNEPR